MTGVVDATDSPGEHDDAGRQIGPFGTAARVVVGFWIVGSVVYGHAAGDFRLAPWVLGLVGFPALLLGWQWWRSRRSPARLEATGPVAQLLNIGVFLALYFMPDYGPLSATDDAALLFYGSSMLIAAVRGYSGCEVLALSNSVLRRDDQVGCLLFAPVDYFERRPSHARPESSRRWPC